MKRGLYLAPFDDLADLRLLAELAMVAESRGWDGLFRWDRVAYPLSELGREDGPTMTRPGPVTEPYHPCMLRTAIP